MGKNVLLRRNSRYYDIGNDMGNYKNSWKSHHRKRRPISEMAIAVEIFQTAYVIITIRILVKETHRQKISQKEKID
jgi:hypothetical protein